MLLTEEKWCLFNGAIKKIFEVIGNSMSYWLLTSKMKVKCKKQKIESCFRGFLVFFKSLLSVDRSTNNPPTTRSVIVLYLPSAPQCWKNAVHCFYFLYYFSDGVVSFLRKSTRSTLHALLSMYPFLSSRSSNCFFHDRVNWIYIWTTMKNFQRRKITRLTERRTFILHWTVYSQILIHAASVTRLYFGKNDQDQTNDSNLNAHGLITVS